MINSASSDKSSFHIDVARCIEQIAFFGSLTVMAALGLDTVQSGHKGSSVFAGVAVMIGLSFFYILLTYRWQVSWPIYAAQFALVGAYTYYRAFVAVQYFIDVAVLAIFCSILFGIAEMLENRSRTDYASATLNFSLALAAGAPVAALIRGQLDDLNVSLVSFAALFFSAAGYRKKWKRAGYAAGVLYNVVLWMWWVRSGLELNSHPQFYLVPAGLSAILYAEANRRVFQPQNVNAMRTIGSLVIALSTAIPMWEFSSFSIWLFLLLTSLTGIFVGIALRVQTFVWVGMVFFIFDVAYQLGRMGAQYAPAKWAIMVGLGIALLIFVALNERQQLGLKMRQAFLQVRQWE